MSPLCAAQLSQSTCANPPCTAPCLPGVEQFVYQGTFTFTQDCPDWIVSFEECCRNNSITNLNAPAGQSLFVSSTLDNTNNLCNSSPVFTSSPVPYICADQPYCYNHGAVDPDGDSLVYSLTNPLDGPSPGNPIGYTSPLLDAQNPLFDNNGVTFDSLTGSLCVNPVDTTPAQVIVIAVQVQEYRNGVLIGTTTRDIQLQVLTCANQQPRLNPQDVTNLVGGVRVDSNSIEICPNVPLSFDIIADDINVLDQVTMATNLGLAIPGATFNASGTNPVTGTISWTPTVADVGFHNFTVTIQDDGCPILGSQIFNFDITVVPSTEASPTASAYCPAGSPVQLGVTGGTNFTWNTISGGPANLSCNNCPNPMAMPSGTATIEVVSDLSAVCKNRDTIVVNLVPDFVLDPGNDTTICRFGLAQLNALTTPGGAGFQPYSFNWSPPDSISNTGISNPTADPTDTTTYIIEAVSAAGCRIIDSVRVNVDGVAPQVVVNPTDTVCAGEDVNLNSFVLQDCGITGNPCTGTTMTDSIGFGTVASPDYGPWRLDGFNQLANIKQYIYTVADLTSMGMTGGSKITNIALRTTGAVGSPVNGVTISMGCTSDTAFTTTNLATGLSVVAPSFNWIPVAGWNDVALTNHFMWDGQSSLIIEICTPNLQAVGTSTSVEYDVVGGNKINFVNSLVALTCGSGLGGVTNVRPKMRFRFCEASTPGLTYLWTPPTFLNNPNIADPTSNPTTTTTYTVNVTDGICIGSFNVTVEAAPLFNLDVGNDTTICLNELLNVDAVLDPGTYTYNWTPSTGVNNPALEDPSILAPDTTTYVLTARSNAGCTRVDSFTVNIDGIAPLVTGLTDTTICPVLGTAQLGTQISQNCGPTSIACSGPVTTAAIEDPSSAIASFLYGPHYIFQAPFGNSNRRQLIYHRAELDSMGFVGGGRINSIALFYTTVGEANTDIQISMGCTTLDEFDASNTFLTGLTQVMPSTSVTPNLGYTVFNFTQPYMWDGQSNLVVEFCTNTLQAGVGPTPWSDVRAHTAPSNLNAFLATNDLVAGACSNPVGTTRTFFRPDMQFSFCDATPPGLNYTWSPGTSLSATNVPNPTSTPTATTTYSIVVDDGGTCTGGDQVTVAIDSINYVVATRNQTVNCPAPSWQLDASVTGPQFVPTLPSCGVNGTVCSQPQYAGTVGSGTGNTNTFYSPLFQVVSDYRSQFLYLASDLVAAGISSGTITALTFNVVDTNSTNPYNGLTFRMGCTNATQMDAATGFLPTTTVLGPVTFDPTLGNNLFTLTSPFDWDGTSNIVIEVCNQNATGSASDVVEYTDALGYNATLIQFTGTPACALPGTAGTAQPGRPNISFTVCPPPPNPFVYNWAPSTGLSNSSIANPTFTDPTPSVADTFTVLVQGGGCDIFDTIIVPPCFLPIEFFELYGEQQDATVKLDWLTRFEVQTDEFIVERSILGQAFEPLGQRDAAGYTTDDRWYNFIDRQPAIGPNKYRIRAVDLNGAITLSNEVTVNFMSESGLISLYPNPVQSQTGFTVEYFAARGGELGIEIIDLYGRTIGQNQVSLQDGFNTFTYDTRSIAGGTYFVRLKYEGKSELKKVLVVE
ncbi:MAG: T9SS type A sorting domain-containing protein [Bacteroidota bacterium]